MLSVVVNNPFRILGVPSNATAKEIKANQSKMKAFLAANKPVSFPSDTIGSLGNVDRNADIVSQATAGINLPQDKFLHALFWFVKPQKEDSIGSMAWDYLISGNFTKAVELFSKRDTYASLIDR